MLELRTVDSDHWSVWRELRLAALAEAPRAFGSTLAEWQGPGDREERWRARLSIPSAHNLVARLDDFPASQCALCQRSPRVPARPPYGYRATQRVRAAIVAHDAVRGALGRVAVLPAVDHHCPM